MSRFVSAYLKHCADSLDQAAGILLTLDGTLAEPERRSRPEIRLCNYAVPENWDGLDGLVDKDTVLNAAAKEQYWHRREEENPDLREQAMRKDTSYAYISRELYPRLRTVAFDFRLHRKDMEQDTIHTTIPDTTYMAGVQAIRDREYERALTLLRPYADFNTAIACCCLDYNASALSILEKMDRSAEVNYMLALLYARAGNDSGAVECYLHACAQNGAFVHRGNLDPEVSALIRKYDLNNLAEGGLVHADTEE